MRVRVVGAGSLGTALARQAQRLGCDVEVADLLADRARKLAAEVGGRAVEVGAPVSDLDLLVETASIEAVRGAVLPALEAGVNCMVLSTGAFTDLDLVVAARRAMERSGARCHLASGGIAGLDAVKALAAEPGARVVLTTRKPPENLGLPRGTSGEVFRGSAADAIKRFPKNVNVAATLELAGLSPEVRVVADPGLRRNTHEITVSSPRAEVRVSVASDPSETNPATSHLALLSAQALLRRMLDPFQVGT